MWGLGLAGVFGYGSTPSSDARPAERPARYLMFGILVTAVCFFNGTEVGLPEIRFVPFAYLLAILLALDLVTRALRYARAPHLAALPLAAILLYWVHGNTSFIPSWLRWNYEGLERKPSWVLLHDMMDSIRGDITMPRVAYENSPRPRALRQHARVRGHGAALRAAPRSRASSCRPTSTRRTSTGSSRGSRSPGTGVIPGYSYPTLDPVRGTNRLDLYNASDMIAVTKEVTEALDKDPRWERKFSRPPYAIYHRTNADPHYVRVPKFRPVMVPTTRWKHDFHHWFATDAAIDVPVVDIANVPPEERSRFVAGRVAWEPPHEPITAKCEITEHIDHMAIDFTTTCPGQPHWIAISYYPNWKVEGASRVYLASPGVHAGLPRRERSPPALPPSRRRLVLDRPHGPGPRDSCSRPAGSLRARRGAHRRARHPARRAPATGRDRRDRAGRVGVTAWNIVRDAAPDHYYKIGWSAFEKQDYVTSQKFFERAMFFGGDSNTAADATFFRAASLLARQQVEGGARRLPAARRQVPRQHVGHREPVPRRSDASADGPGAEAAQRFQYVIDTWPGNHWATISAEQLEQMRKEPGGLGQAPPSNPG